MKKIIYALAIAVAFASCQSAPEGEKAQTSETKEVAQTSGATYKADIANSVVGFVGTKPVGTHNGEFKLSDGSISVENGNITGGSFTIDINSLKITDKDTAFTGKLTGHLLSEDFFKSSQYGTAKFEITSCEALNNDPAGTHKLSGNLTLRDSTQNVSFPAKVTLGENDLNATAEFVIDRTKWGMFYGNDKSLGDKFIYPEVKIMLNLKANKG